jgi:hypothetical protein
LVTHSRAIESSAKINVFPSCAFSLIISITFFTPFYDYFSEKRKKPNKSCYNKTKKGEREMKSVDTILKGNVIQQYRNWYVVDEEFTWNVSELHQTVFTIIQKEIDIPVVFCDTCDANKIVSALGEEEVEYLQFASGLYWREVGIVFIFVYDEWLTLIETIFHELRHVMQDQDSSFRHHFISDKKLPYEKRVTEIDAFAYAKEMMKCYQKSEKEGNK